VNYTSASQPKERLALFFFGFCGIISLLTTLGIILVLFFETFTFFREVNFFSFIGGTEWTPLFSEKQFGVLPLVSGTLLIFAISMIVALPLGLCVSIFISEYSSPRFQAFIKPILEILSAIPTIIYGYFALFAVTPFLQKIIPGLEAFNALSPGIIMGIMILPLIVSLSCEALGAVPHDIKMASHALGSSQLQTIFNVTVPMAISGILAGIILAASRAIGETMLVAIAAGMKPVLTANPLVPVQTITAYIVQVSLGDTPTGTLEYKSIFAVASLLFVITLVFNILAQHLRQSFRNRYG
jgi:phosphate transport system permease protein